jgi:UDP-glucose 4-epimerase
VRRVGITGASGFLGAAVLRHLAARGDCFVRALTRSSPPAGAPRGPTITWQQGDLTSPSDCQDFVDGLDAILHFAHTNTPLTSDRHLPSDARLSLLPTLNLLEALRQRGGRAQLLYASSGGAVYGRRAGGGAPFREDDPCSPASSYGIQKLAAEHYVRLATERGWVQGSCLRIGNPYGVLLPPERRQGLIGVLLAELVRGRPVTLFGDPQNVRDYVHLSDLCALLDVLLARAAAGFEVWNVGSGVGHSVREVVSLLERLHGRRVEVQTNSSIVGAGDLPSWVVLDVTKSAQALGWRPSVSLEEGLARLYRQAFGCSRGASRRLTIPLG